MDDTENDEKSKPSNILYNIKIFIKYFLKFQTTLVIMNQWKFNNLSKMIKLVMIQIIFKLISCNNNKIIKVKI